MAIAGAATAAAAAAALECSHNEPKIRVGSQVCLKFDVEKKMPQKLTEISNHSGLNGVR